MSTKPDATEAVALLADDLRRRMYRFVRGAGRPVSREEVAATTDVSRKLAAFHLDRMVEAGLLKPSYARPRERGGPGAGRSSKYYEPSAVELEVSLPERRYDLVGSLLVEAVTDQKSDESIEDATLRVARERGLGVGRAERRKRGLHPPGTERTLKVAEKVLSENGYEPYRPTPKSVGLRNCPFHSLAQQSPDLVCSMNRSLLEGVVRGLGNRTVQAELACAKPSDCCVTLAAGGRD